MNKISEPISDQKERDEIKSKQIDFIVTTASILITIFILLLINYFIFATYHVDITEIKQQANQMSYKSPSSFMPEPVERLQYMLTIILSPIILLLSYLLIKKYLDKIKDNINIIDTADLGIKLTIIISIPAAYLIIKSMDIFKIYFPKLILSDNILCLIYILVLFPLIVVLTYHSTKKMELNDITTTVFRLIAPVLIIIIFIMGIFGKNTTTYSVYHFNAMFYSVSQVFMGKTLLVDFNNTYGLYPHFIEPILHITGLSVLNYSIIMSALTAISFILLYLFLKNTISNKLIGLLGFTSVIFVNYLIFKLNDTTTFFDSYNQYWPLRFIFPLLLIFLGSVYIKTNCKKIYYCLFVITPISILWNIDSGIFVFISWILLLLFIELYQSDKNIAIRNSAYHLITAAISIITIFGLYGVYIFSRCGIFPNFMQMIEVPYFYVISGFGMLPLLLIHPWTIIFFIYLCGIMYSIKSVINNTKQDTGKMVWLLSVLGLGIFIYYLGRSHDQVLLAPAYVAIIILTIFADINVSEWNKWGLKISHHAIITIIILFILSISIFSIGYHGTEIYSFTKMGISSLNDTAKSDVETNIDFIKSHTYIGEQIYIYANNYDGIYYGETHTESALNIPGYTDQFFIRDHNTISEFIKYNNKTKIFIDKSNNKFIADADSVKDFNGTIDQRYNIFDISSNGQIAMVIPR